MDSRQINKILSQDPSTAPAFKGVFPSDVIPPLQKNSAVVVNRDDSSLPGTHWLCMYVDASDNLEFFDSYGQPPSFYGDFIKDYVSKYSNVCWNSVSFQSPTSNVCGHYCIYFIVKRCQGHSLYSIVRNLSVNKKNDFQMFQFVKKKYGVRMIYNK